MHPEIGFTRQCRIVCCAVSASLCLIVSSGSIAAEEDEMGQPLPSGIQGLSPRFEGVIPESSEWQGATVVGLSGKRIAKTLSKASPDRIAKTLSKTSPDRGAIRPRGRKEVKFYKRAAPSVVYVLASDRWGSGSYIGSKLILTNWHVVQNSQELGILFKPSREGGKLDPPSIVRGTVTKADPVSDLALVKIPLVPSYVHPLELAPAAKIKVGADVHAIGHGHATGVAWTYTRGIISQVRKDFEWGDYPHRATVIQTQTPRKISSGPLLDDSGKLLGVHSWKDKRKNINSVISVEDVSTFLKSNSQLVRPRKSFKQSCSARRVFEGRDQADTGLLIQFDMNCDGKADASLFAPDDKSKLRIALLDKNSDGKVDIIVEDREQDGKWDISFHDVDFDGLTDLVGYHPDGKLAASRYEKHPAALPDAVPPSGAKLFVLLGMSGMNGHGNAASAPPVTNGNHIWRLNADGSFDQNPPEPLIETTGVSPGRYFADTYISLDKATDVVLHKCPKAGKGWRYGVKSWRQEAVDACMERLEPALTAGAVLSGVFVYCCEGDAESNSEVENFQRRFDGVMSRFRSTSGIDNLPFVLTTIGHYNIPCRPRRSGYDDRIKKLQQKMNNYTRTALYHVTAEDQSPLDNSTCFHANNAGQVIVGRRAGAAMP